MSLFKRCFAEFIGTLWLVLGGCGSAVLAATFTSKDVQISTSALYPLGLGFIGVSLAFGLTVLTMAYAIGHISGCHLNPAVSFGLWAGKRFPGNELLPYIIAQVLGAIAGAGIVYLMIILGETDRRAPANLAPIAIGMGLTLIYLISIPVTNTSVNPARSTGPALFAGVELFAQVWLFWLAPILGALAAGLVYSFVFEPERLKRVQPGEIA